MAVRVEAMVVVVAAVAIAVAVAAKAVVPSNAVLSPLAAVVADPASSLRVVPCHPDTEGFRVTMPIRIAAALETRIPTASSLSSGNPSRVRGASQQRNREVNGGAAHSVMKPSYPQLEAVGHVIRVAQELRLRGVALGPLPVLLQALGKRV